MSFDACAELVRKGDPDRFRCAMVARVALRGRLMALYAFNLEIARAPWVTQEPLIAQMRLQFWRDAIAAIYAGKSPPYHQVIPALAQVIGSASLPRKLFDGLIDARRLDITRQAHSSREAFDIYIENSAANLMELAARALGSGDAPIPVIRDFAFASGVANLFTALPALHAAGYDPVPTGAAIDLAGVAAGNAPEPLALSLSVIAKAALVRLERARQNRRQVAPDCLAAMLPGRNAATILRNILKSPEKTLLMPPSTDFHLRWSLLWRASTGLW